MFGRGRKFAWVEVFIMKYLASLMCAIVIAGCGQSATSSTTQPAAPPATQPAEISKKLAPDANNKVKLSDAEWKKILTPTQYWILREKGTERPFTNKYDHHFETGKYVCAACGQELFSSSHKYDSGCGWPAFDRPLAEGKVMIVKDADGMRDEVLCSRCEGHLGHVFDDGPRKTTGRRFCIDSEALKFIPAEEVKKDEAKK
jgi:peptide-methionine (R)-S-oxide reductase